VYIENITAKLHAQRNYSEGMRNAYKNFNWKTWREETT